MKPGVNVLTNVNKLKLFVVFQQTLSDGKLEDCDVKRNLLFFISNWRFQYVLEGAMKSNLKHAAY